MIYAYKIEIQLIDSGSSQVFVKLITFSTNLLFFKLFERKMKFIVVRYKWILMMRERIEYGIRCKEKSFFIFSLIVIQDSIPAILDKCKS